MWRPLHVVLVVGCCFGVCDNQFTKDFSDPAAKGICENNQRNSTVSLLEGADKTLRCNVTTTSGTYIRWFAGDQYEADTELGIHGEVLLLSNVSRTCVARFYRCEEILTSGSSVCNQTFETVVNGPPTVYIYMEEEDFNDTLYEDHLEVALRRDSSKRNIVCSVDSFPPPNITWFGLLYNGRDNITMVHLLANQTKAKKTKEFSRSGENYRFEFEGRILSNSLSTRELTMKVQVGERDTYNKLYTCTAVNQFGNDSWTVKIVMGQN